MGLICGSFRVCKSATLWLIRVGARSWPIRRGSSPRFLRSLGCSTATHGFEMLRPPESLPTRLPRPPDPPYLHACPGPLNPYLHACPGPLNPYLHACPGSLNPTTGQPTSPIDMPPSVDGDDCRVPSDPQTQHTQTTEIPNQQHRNCAARRSRRRWWYGAHRHVYRDVIDMCQPLKAFDIEDGWLGE